VTKGERRASEEGEEGREKGHTLLNRVREGTKGEGHTLLNRRG
jgi:hypothetical protein